MALHHACNGAGGVIDNKRSTDAAYPSLPPRVCVSIQPEYKSCSYTASSACDERSP